MGRPVKLALVFLGLCLAACKTQPPAAPAPGASSAAAPGGETAPSVDPALAAFLAPREGEIPLRAPRLSEDEDAALASCESGRSAKLDTRCKELAVEDLRVGFAQEMERGAREHLVLLARALSAADRACGRGAPNPPAEDAAFGFDAPEWSCVASALTADERQRLTGTFGHVYSFVVDEKLGAYEVVARGPSSELVLRGRLGEEPDPKAVLRRPITTGK